MEDGGREHGKVGSSSGLSWHICSAGNLRTTTPTTAPLSCSYPSSFHPNQNMLPFPTTAHGNQRFEGGEPNHHLTWLKLGKRQYYEGHVGSKKERVLMIGSSSSAATMGITPAAVVVPRCQVEGCNVSLIDSKDYHKRHKVCQVHSKAPKVVVLGVEQRFCQQCSRFHVMSEFDDTKRSCRRKLADHNERRRKSSSDSIMRNPSHGNAMMGGGRYPYISPPPSSSSSSTSPGRALSLLSTSASLWTSPHISLRSSAALRDLIAENRAARLSRQLFVDQHPSMYDLPYQQIQVSAGQLTFPNMWHHFHENNPCVTLDLMQVTGSSPFQFQFLSGRSRSGKEDDGEECCEIWRSLEDTHVL